jgi:ElaB/YqjD/DUF883 family membrane-anchored ribosome-binding protein
MSHTVETKLENSLTQIQAQAAELGERISDGAGELASKVGERTDQAIHQLGDSLSDAASKVLEHTPSSPQLAKATESMASRLQTGGNYLSHNGYGDIVADLTNIVRKHPSQAMLSGLALGIVLGMASSRR